MEEVQFSKSKTGVLLSKAKERHARDKSFKCPMHTLSQLKLHSKSLVAKSYIELH
jgi:hypothetical protein